MIFSEVLDRADLRFTFLSTLTDFDSAIVLMVSILFLIPRSFCPFSELFSTILSTLTSIGITVTFQNILAVW